MHCFPGEKAYRANINFNPEERPITWSQFCKEALPDRTFTFWDWFYAVMKLTRDQLRGPWSEGLIIGFINKRQAEEMLLKCAPGTFLLRFSDSELGKFCHPYLNTISSQKMQLIFHYQNDDIQVESQSLGLNTMPTIHRKSWCCNHFATKTLAFVRLAIASKIWANVSHSIPTYQKIRHLAITTRR